jgi:hypothetical protein
MALNFKKGNGLSLAQTGKVGALAGAVVAGQVVHFDASNNVVAGSSSSLLCGIAISGSTDSDVIASSKLGVLLLEGSSVIETDQADNTINVTNYPVGSVVYGDSSGNITLTGTLTTKIGTVEGVRNLPLTGTGSTPFTQGAFLGVKLSA